jgi:hypothetical protein
MVKTNEIMEENNKCMEIEGKEQNIIKLDENEIEIKNIEELRK